MVLLSYALYVHTIMIFYLNLKYWQIFRRIHIINLILTMIFRILNMPKGTKIILQNMTFSIQQNPKMSKTH